MTFRFRAILIPPIFLTVLSVACMLNQTPAAPTQPDASAEKRLREASATARVVYPVADPSIKIYKARRILELWSGDKLVKSYPCVLGPAPIGDKLRQGDGKTPEGEFYVCTRNDRSKFHLFLGVSYPGIDDAERGVRDGLIAKAAYSRIVAAVRDRERPPWDTALGGEIGIHGGGTSFDWTAGCIALENEAIEELWLACPKKTPISIYQ